MRISREQYEAAYQVGLEFHDSKGALGIVEAKRRLTWTLINSNSAADLIYGVDHLLRGECYKRALSIETTDDYLNWIQRDRGDAYLAKALKALQLHIDYRSEQYSADTCQGLRRLLAKYQTAWPSVKESCLILEWTDADSKGVMDWFPASWFTREGRLSKECHPVGSKSRRQGVAYCDIIVKALTAELDYLPYRSLNDPIDIIPGVIRLHFSDDERTEITDVEWSTDGTRFSPAEYRLPTPVVPPAASDYKPPSIAAEMTERLVRERPGQARFRKELRLVYGHQCCITGCTIVEALEGAHIDPYLSMDSDHLQNGLLLRSDIHALFDKHLIGIDPKTMIIHVAGRVLRSTGYDGLHGTPLTLPEVSTHHPDRAAMARHWSRFQQSS